MNCLCLVSALSFECVCIHLIKVLPVSSAVYLPSVFGALPTVTDFFQGRRPSRDDESPPTGFVCSACTSLHIDTQSNVHIISGSIVMCLYAAPVFSMVNSHRCTNCNDHMKTTLYNFSKAKSLFCA